MASVNTNITVRVIAKGGKYLGADIGGAFITIKNAQTGELLASGHTQGGSGEPQLMTVTINRTQSWPTTQASFFNACLSIAEPVLLEVTASGPGAGLQSINKVTATQWMIPGKDITGGDGLLLELPGLLVQVMSPATHFNAGAAKVNTVNFVANVTMMCGCPISAVAPWVSTDFEVGAMIYQLNEDGSRQLLDTVTLTFSGTTSQFNGSWTLPGVGFYEAVVYAYQPANGNSGMGKVSFFILPPVTGS